MGFFRHSIRKKLVTLLLICTIVPIVSSIVFTFFYTKDMLRDQAVEKNTRLIAEGKENLTTYMERIKNASFSIYYNESLDQTLTSGL